MVDNKKHTVDYKWSDWHQLVHYETEEAIVVVGRLT